MTNYKHCAEFDFKYDRFRCKDLLSNQWCVTETTLENCRNHYASQFDQMKAQVDEIKQANVELGEENFKLRQEIERITKLLYETEESSANQYERAERYEKALQFYANKDIWERIEGHTRWASNLKVDDCALLNCGGGRARLALKEAKGE